jgi:DUF917 family protein
MSYCKSCGNQVQSDWANCPYCSAPLYHATPQVLEETNLDIIILKKSLLTGKLVVQFHDPLYRVSEQISFTGGLRNYTVKTASGFALGNLIIQGVTVMSGFQGMIRFQNGTTYSAVLKVGMMGPKGITISDLTDGRSCMVDF